MIAHIRVAAASPEPPLDPRAADALAALQQHRCLTDREVNALRDHAATLGPVKILGVDVLIWSAAAYAGAGLVLAYAIIKAPHWLMFLMGFMVAAAGGWGALVAKRGEACARRERWKLEDELARLSVAESEWVHAQAAQSPLLHSILRSWLERGCRLRARDLQVIRQYVAQCDGKPQGR
ncbi:hypothetical protein [Rhodanobacter denitrificans]|uniref:hypothetical protein n=1 Tax=Rhodanobacter denitrificans TaxID=666685 RepID=UPI001F2B7E6A|nr:hypothetical protein [Rhodanobacter denitrificans]UJJ60626.1 hypothetical protein LRK55_19520 [Rhodanobacter denitrificans]